MPFDFSNNSKQLHLPLSHLLITQNIYQSLLRPATFLVIGCLTLSSAIVWAVDPSQLPLSVQQDVDQRSTAQATLNAQRDALLRQQQEQKSREHAESSSPTSPVAPETTQSTAPDTPCFTINRIYLQGELADRFSWALSDGIATKDRVSVHNIVRADIEPQCLGAVGVNNLLKRVQNSIIAKGYVTTRVLAQPQNLKSGNLVLTLIPGRVRHIRYVDDKNLQPTTPWRSQLWNIYPSDSDDLLNLRHVEQALENLKRVPTVDADIQIAPSNNLSNDVASVGDSDLLIAWKQTRPVRIQVSLDDSGTKSTGKYQGGVTLSLDNPFHLNDLFYISYNHDLRGGDSGSRGTHGYSGYYSVPLGFSVLSLSSSKYNYHQTVVGANEDLMYSGESENQEIKLSNVIYRDAVRKTSVSVGSWFKSANNAIDDLEVEAQRRRTAGWSLGLSHQDHFGASSLDVNVGYRQGTGARDSLAAPEEAYGEGTSRMRIFTADAQLNVPFTISNQNLHYSLMPRAQWNRTALAPTDRFSIGGRYTVRGFDGENTLLAERGWTVRNDLGLSLGQTGQELYVGVDGGRVSGASAVQLIGQTLIGSAIGVRGGYKSISYDLFAGWPLKKPEGFRTSGVTTGFNLNWSY